MHPMLLYHEKRKFRVQEMGFDISVLQYLKILLFIRGSPLNDITRLLIFRYDNVPPEINRLRCRVNYHALKFLPEIEQMADSLASRMRNRNGASNPYMYVTVAFEIILTLFRI